VIAIGFEFNDFGFFVGSFQLAGVNGVIAVVLKFLTDAAQASE
jgi:hypothetical protein